MTFDHFVDHITSPSTIRGLCWLAGSGVAAYLIFKEQYKEALEVLTISATVVGGIGVFTRDPAVIVRKQETVTDDSVQ